MHYTSIENIHKVIDPLFLDGLKRKLADITDEPVFKRRLKALHEFQDQLASLVFLDPACGSGNFLTETYLSLRRLENQVIKLIYNMEPLDAFVNPIKVSINQFYGIEINDFAVTVATTALWISESQMMAETESIIHHDIDFLPLHSYANIHEGNALHMDWRHVCPHPDYIIGNPPFVGYSLQSKEQKADILSVFVDRNGKPFNTAGKIDYVAAWYYKAAEMMQGTNIRAALVSTNSITQGEQVASIWKPLRELFGIHIDFAYRTFRWDSEANLRAHVHCIIVGFSCANNTKDKIIFDNGQQIKANNINAYLIDAPDEFIESRNKPICEVPYMTTGNRPADGGNLIIEADEYDDFIKSEPAAKPFIKKLLGSAEFINNKKRWCLWLVNASPAQLRSMPHVMERIQKCKADRLASPDAGRRKLADKPALFRELNNPSDYIAVPKVSSEKRRYVPMGFLHADTIATDLLFILPSATLYHFGILESNVHMAWMRVVCGRLKSDYRYSKDVVYNNFPWPSPTAGQAEKIATTAQGILDARSHYPDSSLADLYNPNLMPYDLLEAHRANDRAVMAAYGFATRMTETECVSRLFDLYSAIVHMG